MYSLCFQLLRVPFTSNAEIEQGVTQENIRSVVDFKRDPWPKVSDNAKDLVKTMLNPDPTTRLTAQEVLCKILINLRDNLYT